MKNLLQAYESKEAEIIFEWNDTETDAQGWVVINSLKGGAAGGGTRMRVGLDKYEVISLAKTMEVKFTVSGPAIGGAKSGINFDPNDPRKKGVLQRWFKAIRPLLKNYYGTGGDLNIDEIDEVIPITKKLGISHPQEGVFNGHFNPSNEERSIAISQLQKGVLLPIYNKKYSPDTAGKYTVADMITGFGVSEAIRHYYNTYGGSIYGKRVIIQGWGNVGAAAAYYQAQLGAKIVGIIDRDGGLINRDGFKFEEIKSLFLKKDGNFLNAQNILSFEEITKKIWTVGAEIFIPAAASRLVTLDQIDSMISHGLEVVSCGANVPFADKAIFFGPIGEYTDEKVSLIPDFIANCGMARVFAYLMQAHIVVSDKAIFEDISKTIANALLKSYSQSHSKTKIAKTAFEIALRQLV